MGSRDPSPPDLDGSQGLDATRMWVVGDPMSLPNSHTATGDTVSREEYFWGMVPQHLLRGGKGGSPEGRGGYRKGRDGHREGDEKTLGKRDLRTETDRETHRQRVGNRYGEKRKSRQGKSKRQEQSETKQDKERETEAEKETDTGRQLGSDGECQSQTDTGVGLRAGTEAGGVRRTEAGPRKAELVLRIYHAGCWGWELCV